MPTRTALKCIDDPGILELAEGLRVLSDPNRLRIVCLLLKGERCVCEVEKELGISQQLASHHLNVLKEAGFLASRKEATSSYYAVVPGRMERILEVMQRYLVRGDAGSGEDMPCCGAARVSREGGKAGARECSRLAAGRKGSKMGGGLEG